MELQSQLDETKDQDKNIQVFKKNYKKLLKSQHKRPTRNETSSSANH